MLLSVQLTRFHSWLQSGIRFWLALFNSFMASLTAFLYHNSSDETQTGHVLGLPEGRTNTHPERKLSPIACCIIRVLMHSALLWASCNNHVCVYNGLYQCLCFKVDAFPECVFRLSATD